MKNEYKLILSGVLINKSAEENKEIDNLLNMKINWGEVAGVLLNHRLGGYFYMHLTDRQRVKIPKEMRKALELLVRAQKEVHSELIIEQNLVGEELNKTDIRYAMLKGAFFSSDIYDIGARRSNDLDMLVYEEDLELLDIHLRKLGYIQSNMPNGEMLEASKKEKLIQRMNYHDLVPYVKRIKTEILELDINFLFDDKDNLIDKTVFEMGTKIYNGRNYSVKALNPYTNLAFLCSHFYREATNTIWTSGKRDVVLYKIVDIVNFIRSYESTINIDEYIDVANKINMIEKTAYTFKIINEFYDLDFISEFNVKANTDSILSEEFMNKIYDHKNKTTILRNESFYDTAFSCVL